MNSLSQNSSAENTTRKLDNNQKKILEKELQFTKHKTTYMFCPKIIRRNSPG